MPHTTTIALQSPTRTPPAPAWRLTEKCAWAATEPFTDLGFSPGRSPLPWAELSVTPVFPGVVPPAPLAFQQPPSHFGNLVEFVVRQSHRDWCAPRDKISAT